MTATPAPATAATGPSSARARRPLGIGVIGFGWLGQAHSRSLQRIRTLFGERTFEPRLVACGDAVPART